MANLGKFQKVRSKRASGSRSMISGENGKRYKTSPRIASSFPDRVFERLVWLAEAQDVPVAQIIRDACEAYVHVVNAPIDAVQIARIRTAKISND